MIIKIRNIIIFTITVILFPLLYLIMQLKKKSNLNNQKILFIQLSQVGDLICTTPLYRLVKKKLPEAQIDVLTKSSLTCLLRGNPYIDNILGVEDKGVWKIVKEIRKNNKYDHVIVLTPSVDIILACVWSLIPKRTISLVNEYGRLNKIATNIFCTCKKLYVAHQYTVKQYIDLICDAGIDIKVDNPYLEDYNVYFNKTEKDKTREWLVNQGIDLDNDFLVGIAVVTGSQFKVWPLEKFVELAKELINEYNVKIISIGISEEKEIISDFKRGVNSDRVFIRTDFSLNESAALFSHLNMFVSSDCGQLYLAHAVGAPVVDIVGPIDKLGYPPLGNRCEVVDYKVSCQPCCFGALVEKECKLGTSDCLWKTEVSDVMKSVDKLIKKYNLH